MSEELRWYEKSGPYRLEISQGPDQVEVTGPEGSRLPMRFDRKMGEGVCYWMNEAYSFGRRSEPPRREVKEEIRKLKEDLAASRASHVMSGAAVQKLEEKLAERREAEQRVIEAAKQKYRSIIYTSGVSQEFADKELVEAVAALLGDSKPLSECNRAVDPGNHEDCTACLAAPPSVEVPPAQEPCEKCGGDGQIEYGVGCIACAGSGKAPAAPSAHPAQEYDHEFEYGGKWPGICGRCGGEHKPAAPSDAKAKERP